jgi:hypothetical protein
MAADDLNGPERQIAAGHREPLNDLSAEDYGPVETREGPDDEPDDRMAGAPALGLGLRGGLRRLQRLPGRDNYRLLILAGQLVRAASATGRLANNGVSSYSRSAST